RVDQREYGRRKAKSRSERKRRDRHKSRRAAQGPRGTARSGRERSQFANCAREDATDLQGHQTALITSIGFARVARTAGTAHATIVTTSSVTSAATSDVASTGYTPYILSQIRKPAHMPNPAPTAVPPSAITSASDSTSFATFSRVAPSATRTANSRMRCAARYDTTLNRPAAPSASDATPSSVNTSVRNRSSLSCLSYVSVHGTTRVKLAAGSMPISAFDTWICTSFAPGATRNGNACGSRVLSGTDTNSTRDESAPCSGNGLNPTNLSRTTPTTVSHGWCDARFPSFSVRPTALSCGK